MESENVSTESSPHRAEEENPAEGSPENSLVLKSNEQVEEEECENPCPVEEKELKPSVASDSVEDVPNAFTPSSLGCEAEGKAYILSLYISDFHKYYGQADETILCKATPEKDEGSSPKASGSKSFPPTFKRKLDFFEEEEPVDDFIERNDLSYHECTMSTNLDPSQAGSQEQIVVEPSDESEEEINESPDMFSESESEHGLLISSNIIPLTPIKEKRLKRQRMSRSLDRLSDDGIERTPRRSFLDEENPQGRKPVPRNLSLELGKASVSSDDS